MFVIKLNKFNHLNNVCVNTTMKKTFKTKREAIKYITSQGFKYTGTKELKLPSCFYNNDLRCSAYITKA